MIRVLNLDDQLIVGHDLETMIEEVYKKYGQAGLNRLQDVTLRFTKEHKEMLLHTHERFT